MQKIKAFLVHLFISSIVLSIFLGIVWFIWYPTPLLKVEGAFHIIVLFVSIDLILGPSLTAVVYKKNKKGLFLDLAFIALVQITALLYGMHTLYMERPLYIAFDVDRFTLIPAASINTDDLYDKKLLTKLFDKPMYVFIEKPKNQEIRENIMMESITGGKDYTERPEFYRDLASHTDSIAHNIRQLRLKNILKLYPEAIKLIENLAQEKQQTIKDFIFYPLQGKQTDMVVVLKKDNLRVLGILDINPWPINKYQANIRKQNKRPINN